MDHLLSVLKLHPGVDFSRELSGILDANSLWLLDAKRTDASGPQKSLLGTPSAISPTSTTVEDYDSSEDDIASHLNLKRSMEALTLNAEYPRYLGKSSRLRFYKRACDLKSDYTGQEQRDPTLFTQRLRLSMTRNKYWKNERVSNHLIPCSILYLKYHPVDHERTRGGGPAKLYLPGARPFSVPRRTLLYHVQRFRPFAPPAYLPGLPIGWTAF